MDTHILQKIKYARRSQNTDVDLKNLRLHINFSFILVDICTLEWIFLAIYLGTVHYIYKSTHTISNGV